MDADGFCAEVVETEGEVCVVISGEVDVATAPLVDDAIMAATARRPTVIRVDLSAVTFIDSSGLSALLRARQLVDGSCRLVLGSPTEQARKVFGASGVDRVLTIED